jgi:hypothetical protein
MSAITSFCLTAQAPLQLGTKDSNLRVGFLSQASYEAAGSSNSQLKGMSQNIFLRRMCLFVGGSLTDKVEFFFNADTVDLGKGNTDGEKSHTTDTVFNDAALTYKFTDKIKLDAGYLIVPLSHHSTQAGTNIHSWDLSAYAMQASAPMGSKKGNRDGGIQLRGIIGKPQGNLEFRVGAWQGKRAPEKAESPYANNSLRFAARAQWNFFDAEGGLLLGGSYLGAKKVMSVGAGYDRQDDYSATAFDVFVDLPIGENGIMGQFNHVMWDGKTWLPGLAKQTTDFAELGYRIGALKLSPMVRYEARKMDVPTPTAAGCDETRFGAGLAWWLKGHQNNLKAFYIRVDPKNVSGSTALKSYGQFNVQWQLLFW